MTTLAEIIAELKSNIANGEEIDGIRENSGEYIGGYLPIYNNEIVKEWQEMPSEYDNCGAVELGHPENEINIINLMSLDLYLYYSDLFNVAFNAVESELAGADK